MRKGIGLMRTIRIVLLAGLPLAVLLAGCKGGSGDDSVTGGNSTVYAGTPIPPGEDCAYGGVRIDYGIDENGNGLLDSSEVDGYSVVCNGAGSQPAPATPPDSPAGQFAIRAAGGMAGGALTGAPGGNLEIYLQGSGTGHILLFSTGLADASFAFPSTVPTYLGLSPLVVTSDLTVAAYDAATHTGMAPGEVHFHTNVWNGPIYWGDGTGTTDAGTVTGISVASGATLTFALGYYAYAASVSVPNDIRNEGTLTTARMGTEGETSGQLSLTCDTFYGAPGSSILLAGTLTSTGNGGDGGSFSLMTTGSIPGLPTGAIYNAGLIDTSGADGTIDYGGNGGQVSLNGEVAIFNTALIDTSGGDSDGSDGGYAREIWLDAYSGGSTPAPIFNSGTLDASGGNGAFGGGNGAAVSITAGGDVRNSGDILAQGGDGAGGGGGHAGMSEGAFVMLTAYGGSIYNSGDILAHGGAGVGEAWGGDGAALDVTTYNDDATGRPAGSIHLSGSLDASGGDGDYGGGWGNTVTVSVQADGRPAGQEIRLLGYTGIDLSGGSNTSNGGYAGSLLATNSANSTAGFPLTAGGVYNYVPVTARGGNAGMGSNTGGMGGAIELVVASQYGYQAPWEIAANFADADLSGGSGFTGGDSGAVYLYGSHGAQNHGDLTVNGGAGYDFGGNPGAPTDRQGIFLISLQGVAINTGTIVADGGAISDSGGGTPGTGNLVRINGALAVHSGPLVAVRGGANTPDTEGDGADGGAIVLQSWQGASAVSGNLDASGSAGYLGDPANAGADGVILVDGINRTAEYPAP